MFSNWFQSNSKSPHPTEKPFHSYELMSNVLKRIGSATRTRSCKLTSSSTQLRIYKKRSLRMCRSWGKGAWYMQPATKGAASHAALTVQPQKWIKRNWRLLCFFLISFCFWMAWWELSETQLLTDKFLLKSMVKFFLAVFGCNFRKKFQILDILLFNIELEVESCWVLRIWKF